METEDLHLPEQGQVTQGASPALLPSAPRRCLITTERGKDVPLTLAGYRLSFGRTYHIRVAAPVKDVQLVGFPNSLIRKQAGTQVITWHGDSYHCIPIRVNPIHWLDRLTHHGVYPHDLEIEVTLNDGRRVPVRIPVVLQVSLTWRLLMLIVAWGVISFLIDLLADAIWERDLSLFTSYWPWISGLGVALLYPAARMAHRLRTLYGRAEDLRQDYLQRWGTLEDREPLSDTEG